MQASMPDRSRRSLVRRSPALADGDRDLFAIALVIWATGAFRVAMALVHHEVFGTEATLALACTLLIPSLIFASLRRGS